MVIRLGRGELVLMVSCEEVHAVITLYMCTCMYSYLAE